MVPKTCKLSRNLSRYPENPASWYRPLVKDAESWGKYGRQTTTKANRHKWPDREQETDRLYKWDRGRDKGEMGHQGKREGKIWIKQQLFSQRRRYVRYKSGHVRPSSFPSQHPPFPSYWSLWRFIEEKALLYLVTLKYILLKYGALVCWNPNLPQIDIAGLWSMCLEV